MAKTGDVMFTKDKGGAGEKEYNFMLAVHDNEKAWWVDQWRLQPPSLILAKIDMVVLAAPEMTQADGTPIDTRKIGTVLTELATLAAETSLITLDGLDNETYNVKLDRKPTKTKSVKDESGTITQYEIAVSAWGMAKV